MEQQVITADELTQEAAQLALELRFAHRKIRELSARVARLEAEKAAGEGDD